MGQHVARGRVAVLGLGVSGVTAVKNLLEQGFDVIAYERNPHIGGLWQYNEDPNQTTVLKVTKANGSKQFSAYSDFPFPDDMANYPTAAEIAHYMRDYARHFSLEKHFRLNTEVEYVSHVPRASSSSESSESPYHEPIVNKTVDTNKTDKTDTEVRWAVRIRDEDGTRTEEFDKVLVTTGPWGRAFTPDKPGMDQFEGKIMHAQGYKGHDGFEGKQAVVVGMSNTGCDIAVDLSAVAAKVSTSHRGGIRIGQRDYKSPIEWRITRRAFAIGVRINETFPSVAAWLADKIWARKFRQQKPGYKAEWGFFPTPPPGSSPGGMNDYIVDLMIGGKIHNLFGIKRFTSNGVVTAATKDGQGEVETKADVVIFATAYDFDYSFLSPEADPTAFPMPEWDALGGHNNNLRFPRLYKTLFPPTHADTLAFVGPCRGFSAAAFSNSDLASQAIAQVWKGAYTLLSPHAMEEWCDENYQRALTQSRSYRIPKVGMDPVEFERWLNDVVGNEVNERLGWGWQGWKFWWKERKFYYLIMDGINTPFVYRLWDGRPGGRKKWDGAREAIYEANGRVPP